MNRVKWERAQRASPSQFPWSCERILPESKGAVAQQQWSRSDSGRYAARGVVLRIGESLTSGRRVSRHAILFPWPSGFSRQPPRRAALPPLSRGNLSLFFSSKDSFEDNPKRIRLAHEAQVCGM